MLKVTQKKLNEIMAQCDSLETGQEFSVLLKDESGDVWGVEFKRISIFNCEYIVVKNHEELLTLPFAYFYGGIHESKFWWYDTSINNKSAVDLLLEFLRSDDF